MEPDVERRMADRVALVTGAASGIGLATARLFARHGALVYCADRDAAGVAKIAAELAPEHGANGLILDVTDETQWQDAIATITQQHQRLDVLVQSAGIALAAPIEDETLVAWRQVFAVNVEGAFLGMKHTIRAMRQGGHGGSIVNIASLSGVKAQPGASAYCASKAALIMLTKTVALECLRKGDGIRVNSISPSGVKTPMWTTMPFFQELLAREGSMEGAFAAMAQDSPQGRWAEPEEIASVALFLASRESSYITATNLNVDYGDSA